MMDLPDQIPIFPLPGVLLLPRARLPLHIFEPRYLAMIEDCLRTPQRLIGMIQTQPAPDGLPARLAQIGCAGRLTGFSETDDGRYMITLTGVSRFRLGPEVVGGLTPYRRFAVDWQGFAADARAPAPDRQFDRSAFMSLLARYFRARKLGTDWEGLKEAEEETLINALSMLLPLDPADKQALLEAPSLTTRRETLTGLIEFALLRGEGTGPDEVLQ